MPFCEVPGLRLYYERAGEGSPLLFISGTGGDLRQKPSAMDGPFAREFDLVGYDQRGLGQSGVPDGPYTMAQYGEDAADLLGALGWSACLVVGVSFGGMVAQELAIRHPSLVRRLVLACTSAGGAGGSSYPLHTISDLRGEARVRTSLELADTRFDSRWQAEHPDQWRQMLDVMTAQMAASPAGLDGPMPGGSLRQLEARSHHDTADRLGSIACPTLVCGGRYDGIAPPANSEFLASAIPGAELALFEGGHMFLVQDRTAFGAISDFLRA